MVYNKLVRDRIPEIIAQSGGTAEIRILDEEEFLTCLEAKLAEETAEFHRDKTAEELADILEVVFALASAMGCDREELMEICRQKHTRRGGFEKKILLIASENKK